VLVDLQAGQVGQVHLDTGVDHRLGQVGRLLRGHAAQDDRHQERRNLVLGPGAVGDGPDEGLDLLTGERAAVPFARDDVDGTHEWREYVTARG
jgi:hypothetical protein